VFRMGVESGFLFWGKIIRSWFLDTRLGKYVNVWGDEITEQFRRLHNENRCDLYRAAGIVGGV
jgi:hypothetical protein